MNYEELIKQELQKNKQFLIWYTGSRNQAEYIESYSGFLKNNSILLPLPDSAIKQPSPVLPKTLIDYLFLDFPDIIVMSKNNKQPIIGIEILEQKPVGWNHTQRFSRAAASAIRNIPFAYIMPQKRYLFDKGKPKKGERQYIIGGEKYKENLRKEFQLLNSLYKLTTIHKIPCLPFFWPINDQLKYLSEGLIYNDDPILRWEQLPPAPVNKNGEIFEEILDFFQFLDLCIDYFMKGKKNEDLIEEDIVQKHLLKIDPQYTNLYILKNVTLKNPDGGNIKIAERVATESFVPFLENRTNLKPKNQAFFLKLLQSEIFKQFLSKNETVVVNIDADPFKGGRGFSDPYSGVISSFDYRYCRNVTGNPDILKRDTNLVFVCLQKNATSFFENLLKEHFKADCLDNDFPNMKISWQEKEKVSELAEITKRLASFPQASLKKELKIFFYFCDLIIFSDNLFLGYPVLRLKV